MPEWLSQWGPVAIQAALFVWWVRGQRDGLVERSTVEALSRALNEVAKECAVLRTTIENFTHRHEELGERIERVENATIFRNGAGGHR